MDTYESPGRAALRNAFGAGKYRITRDGEIHVYGRMPNSTKTGWYPWSILFVQRSVFVVSVYSTLGPVSHSVV